jgi:hypothetical protein
MLSSLTAAESCGTANPIAQLANLQGPVVQDSRFFEPASQFQQAEEREAEATFHVKNTTKSENNQTCLLLKT